MNTKLALSTLVLTILAGCNAPESTDTVANETAALSQETASARVITPFDPSKGELPEGLALRGDDAYVGFAPLAEVRRVDRDGHAAPYGTLPTTFGGSKGLTLGLAFGEGGQLYVAQASFDVSSVVPGVYAIPTGGGAVTQPWSTHPEMTFPNGLDVDGAGDVWVADSGGAIFKIDPDGHASSWLRHPLLVGDPATCGFPIPIPIGANGIVATPTDVWVTNTDRGALVRVPLLPDGTAGAPEAVLDDCAYAGADGLARKEGELVFAVNAKNEIVRWSREHGPSVVATGRPLDFPASVVFRGGDLYVSDLAFLDKAAPSLALAEAHR
jgi:sugar lactone lactonase YvrE